jgi:DNA-binding transcriptional ArsR family regulator
MYMSVVESSFAIIAQANRRAILSLLLSSERSVGEIERELRLRSDSGFPSASDTLRSVLS